MEVVVGEGGSGLWSPELGVAKVMRSRGVCLWVHYLGACCNILFSFLRGNWEGDFGQLGDRRGGNRIGISPFIFFIFWNCVLVCL